MTGQVIYHLLAAAHASRAPLPGAVLVSCPRGARSRRPRSPAIGWLPSPVTSRRLIAARRRCWPSLRQPAALARPRWPGSAARSMTAGGPAGSPAGPWPSVVLRGNEDDGDEPADHDDVGRSREPRTAVRRAP